MKMEDFYVRAGLLLHVLHRREGDGPEPVWIAEFQYQFGKASYDGKAWTMELEDKTALD